MHPDAPNLAPTDQLIRYLACFARFFEAVVEYERRGDRAGMLLCGWLANALHNVPAMLWDWREDAGHNPQRVMPWFEHVPQQLAELGAPERVRAEAEHILSSVNARQALQGDAETFVADLAPISEMRTYLDWLYKACLSMRSMTGFGKFPRCWDGLEDGWPEHPEDAEAAARFNAALASVMVAVPSALVQWSGFDEDRFRSDLQRVYDSL